jgi:hypothetical protein
VSVEGTAAPSAIVEAIQATGRDAVLRGSGKSDSTSMLTWHVCLGCDLDVLQVLPYAFWNRMRHR